MKKVFLGFQKKFQNEKLVCGFSSSDRQSYLAMGSKDTSKDLRIIIVGGGIAGLSAVSQILALTRSPIFNVVLYQFEFSETNHILFTSRL